MGGRKGLMVYYYLKIQSIPTADDPLPTSSSHTDKHWLRLGLEISSDWGSSFFTRKEATVNTQSIQLHTISNP